MYNYGTGRRWLDETAHSFMRLYISEVRGTTDHQSQSHQVELPITGMPFHFINFSQNLCICMCVYVRACVCVCVSITLKNF